MDAQARAGIDLHENILRYAEIEQFGDHCRLLRLGSCDFDFDVSREVLYAPESPHLDTITEALSDVFAGSAAASLNVALHPPSGFSFFTPVSSGLSYDERERRVFEEVSLLTATNAARTPALRVTTDPVFEETLEDGQAVSWLHVLAMQKHVHDRFEYIFRGLPYPNHRLKLSMQATANVMNRLSLRRHEGKPNGERPDYSLALGWYNNHVEYTLCRDGRWYFSHYADVQSPADGAYFAVTLLQRLGLAAPDVRELYVYGNQVSRTDLTVLEAVFEARPETLNPIAVMDLDPGSLSAIFEAEAYVPCIGAAL